MAAAMVYDEADGIAKKIALQAAALSNDGDCSALVCFGNKGILKFSFNNGVLEKKDEICGYKRDSAGENVGNEIRKISLLLDVLKDQIDNQKPNMIYIRHMIPQRKLVAVLQHARRKNVRIAYEIPTYPYYREQMNVSHNKVKTAVKLGLETVFWPFIYNNIDKLCIMCCNSKAHIYKKMVPIKNGFSGEKQEYIKRNTRNIEMIGVGTIYPYHGYDRIIEAMKECDCKLASGGEIFFHIVGKSDEIERLKKYVESIGLEKNVIFHGVQYGENLKRLYMKCNLGVGTMALSLRNADIDTAIKNIEYMSFYLPVISSGKIFDIKATTGIYKICDEATPVEMNDVFQIVKSFYDNWRINETVDEIIDSFSWRNIMMRIKQL